MLTCVQLSGAELPSREHSVTPGGPCNLSLQMEQQGPPDTYIVYTYSAQAMPHCPIKLCLEDISFIQTIYHRNVHLNLV